MKKVVYILISIFIIFILLSQIDDELSDDAKNFINRIDTDRNSESFLYLYGIFAKENEDPIKVGKNILEEYQKLNIDTHYQVIDYPESEKLPLPQGDEFCTLGEEGCLAFMFSSKVNVEKLLDKHRVLISRSNRFLEFDEYSTLSKPTITELFPPYQYISKAERIKVLKAISIFKNGETDKAIDLLLTQFNKLRKAMELQDTMIGKLVYLSKLSEIIDVYSIILSKEGLNTDEFPNLTDSEKSFYMVAAREFAIGYYSFLGLDKAPDFFQEGGNFPGWVIRMLYKPNMTINSTVPMYQQIESLTKMPPHDFVKYIEAESALRPSSSKVRNYIGNILLGIASPSFDEYAARFFDLEAKLALFNQIYHFDQKMENFKNPYYGQERPKKVKGSLCFSGPLEDSMSLRCVRIKI